MPLGGAERVDEELQGFRLRCLARVDEGFQRIGSRAEQRTVNRFVVGTPACPDLLDRIQLLSRAPVVRFNVGPLVVEGPDGRKIRDSEVLHMFYPSRPLER